MKDKTRERWLHDGLIQFNSRVFKQHDLKLPKKIKISIGWPYASRGTKKLGECWAPEVTADKSVQIFVSPVHSEGREALSTLMHEAIHAIVGKGAGHGPVFRKAALRVGLIGKMRSAGAGPALFQEIDEIIKVIGPFPHSQMDPGSGRKKQTTRMYKMECQECGYVARSSRKYLMVRGPLICPCNYQQMNYDETLEEETSED